MVSYELRSCFFPCMEGSESGLNSYYQAGPSANNGMFGSPTPSNLNASSTSPYSEGAALVFPHSAGGRPTAAVPEVVRRKRGRPRKYGPGADGAVRHAAAVGVPLSSVARKKEPASAKKAQMVALGMLFKRFGCNRFVSFLELSNTHFLFQRFFRDFPRSFSETHLLVWSFCM